MPRPTLALGTSGLVKVTAAGKRGPWTARARFRDYDGVTRLVERSSTKSAEHARTTLALALKERATPAGDELTSESTIRDAGEKWWADEIEGQKADSTERRYEQSLHLVNDGIGGLRLREATTARLDAFIRATATNRGPSAAKGTKTVLSGLLGLAARMDAIGSNPIRDVGRIRNKRTEVRALTLDELRTFRARLHAFIGERLERDGRTVNDLVDPIDFMVGTGARIGEVLGLKWEHVDLDAEIPTALIAGTATWKRGAGMTVKPTPKTDTSRRRLSLPPFVVDMLRARDRTSELVFPSLVDTIRDPNNFRKELRRFTTGTEFDWVTPHSFRRTVGTLVEDIADASSQLGHAGIAITEKHYRMRTHQAPDLRAILQLAAEPANAYPTKTPQRTSISAEAFQG